MHGGPSTVPRTEPNKRMLPGHTPTTRHGGQSSSSSSQDKSENYPERSDGEEFEHDPTDRERPIKSVLGEISNMLGTVLKT